MSSLMSFKWFVLFLFLYFYIHEYVINLWVYINVLKLLMPRYHSILSSQSYSFANRMIYIAFPEISHGLNYVLYI